MKFDRKKHEEEFQEFLLIMDDQLDQIQEDARIHDIKMDLSEESIENVEYFFDKITNEKDLNYQKSAIVYVARYVGEVFRRHVGGKWGINLIDNNDIYFNIPVIVNFSQSGKVFSPITAVRAYALRRVSGTIKRAYKANAAPTSLNLDDLVEK